VVSQEGAKELARAVSMVEREKEEAAAAAASATMSAAKAEDILGSFTSEIANARRKSVQFQVSHSAISRCDDDDAQLCANC
jgi:hypothetical protein